MKGHLTMSYKERKYLSGVQQVQAGHLTVKMASEYCGISTRQMYRLLKSYREKGEEGLVHGLRGKTSNRGYSRQVREQVKALYLAEYADYGPTLFAEQLQAQHQLRMDHETLRRWLKGLYPHSRKAKGHRKKRARREAWGDLLQLDGSHHDWFEGRRSGCCLLVAVDDASSRSFFRFCESENEWDLMRFLRDYGLRFGRPVSLYVDRAKTIYSEDKPTAIAQALEIEIRFALSPQAKGRLERHNRTLQDRLVKALRHLNIDSIEEANLYLEKTFMNEYNALFASSEPLPNRHRNLQGYSIESIFSFPCERIVRADYTLQYQNQFYQLLNGKAPLPRPGQKAIIRRYLDHSLHIFYNDQELLFEVFQEKPSKPITRKKTSNLYRKKNPSLTDFAFH